jgi:hypothetical protein
VSNVSSTAVTAVGDDSVVTEAVDGRISAAWLLVPLAVVGLTAIAGYRLLRLANADSLLPGLFSTQEMTWFYWGQDRLANVVPLLATPVQDLRWNLALQLFLIGLGWFTLIALFAANHQHRGERSVTPLRLTVVVITSAAINLALLKPNTRWVFIFEQLYAFSTVLLLVGLFALTRDRIGIRVVGVGVVTVAMMINPSLLLLAPVAFVLPQRPEARVQRVVAAGAAMLVAFVLTSVASNQFSGGSRSPASYSDFSLRRSVDNLETSFDRISGSMNFRLALCVVAAAVVVLALRWRNIDRRHQITLVGAVAFGTGWTVLFTGNEWVAANLFYERYFFPIFAAVHLLITAAVSESIDAICERVPADRRPRTAAMLTLPSRKSAVGAAVAATLLMSAVTVWRFTRLSVDALVAARPAVAAARAADAQFVVGDYWTAWPAVILGRMEGEDLEGIAYRFDPRRDDVAAAIEDSLAADGQFNVLCVSDTIESCVGLLQFLTETSFQVERVVSESPLILTIRSTGRSPGG